jgi:GT2 family glycosyltransferase
MSEPVTRPRVAVVVLTWNGLDDLLTCLESFSCVDYPNYEIVVVDNASEDATVPTVRERFPSVTLIVNESNLGYVGGNNVGIRCALEHGANYVFILNNDTKMTPNVLSELVRVMESDPRIAITGAKNLLMEYPEYTWGKYGKLTWGPMLVATVGRFERDRPETSPKDVEWVIGNGCLMRREALERVGLFDESFFQVNEDVDWSLRARQLGYRVVYLDTVAIHHRGAGSADPTKRVAFSYLYFLGRNAIMFARKHANALQWAKLLTLLVVGFFMRTAAFALLFGFYAVAGQRAFLVGMLDGLRRQVRQEQTTGIVRGPARPPSAGPVVRFLRWLGA